MAEEIIEKKDESGVDSTTEKLTRDKELEDEKTMPFLDHLEDLRWCLIKCLITITVMGILSYIFSDHIMNFLTAPFFKDDNQNQKLIFLAPTEGFMIRIKVSLFAGLIIGLPLLFTFIWQFVAPGLYKNERKITKIIIFMTTLCFLIGAFFAYYIIIPFAFQFLLGYQTAGLEANITIDKYLGFVTMMIFTFGIVFEMPILAYLFTRLGLLNPDFMKKYRPHAIVLIFIIAAIITPPDVFTQVMLGIPLVILYEISIFVSKFVLKKERKKPQ